MAERPERARDAYTRVAELRPIPWGLVRVELVNPGKVIYHVTGDHPELPEHQRLLATFARKYPFWRDLASQSASARPNLVFLRMQARSEELSSADS